MKMPKYFLTIFAAFVVACHLGTASVLASPKVPPGKNVGIASIPNLRDVGGYKTSDNKIVATGLIYHSNQLSAIPPIDMERLSGLGLKNAFDLRTAEERHKRPEELPAGVNYVVLDVLADSPQSGAATLGKLMSEPKLANEQLGGGKIEAKFKQGYREFVFLPSAKREFGKLFLALADSKQVPALFNCTTGRDRTGWAAAAFLTLMGVPKDKVYEDYLRSNEYILPAYKKAIDGFFAAGGDAEITMAILGVKSEYLDAAFDEMHQRYGSLEQYFSLGLGISKDTQDKLKAQYRTSI